MGDHYPFKFHHSTSRAHQGCIELTTSDAAIRFHADGAVTVDTTIQAHERSDYLRDDESPNDVDEIDLVATTTQSLRLAALHAQLRAGTTGTAITSLAAWANAAIDVRGRKPGDYTDRVGISPLHTHLVRYTSEIALDSVAINEGSAAHAAWLILNELYQEQLGTPTSTLMGHDGNYRLHLLDDRGATLHIVDHNPDRFDLLDINDRPFAEATRTEHGYNVQIEDSTETTTSRDQAIELGRQRLRTMRHWNPQ